MKNNKKISLCILILLGISLYPLVRAAHPIEDFKLPFSAILVAHGSKNDDHNKKIIDLKKITNPSLSALEVAFLGNDSQGKMDTVLELFRAEEPKNILLIPLSSCSYLRHEEIAQLALKKGKKIVELAKEHPGDKRIGTLDFTVAPAMDDHPLAAEIIKEHARGLSKDPEKRKKESLLLFAAGPDEELENIDWLRRLEQMGNAIGTELGFQEVGCATLRNHSPDLIAEQSIIDLRRKARALTDKGKRRVIVVPYVFEDGPYEELQSYLKDIVPPEDIVSVGFISNAKTEEWVKEVITQGMNQPTVKAVNKHWSTEKGPKGNF